MYWFFSQLIIFQEKCISVSLRVSWSVSSAHIGFGHHMPNNQYRLPFITTLDTVDIGYVCHMTACIIFVGMFLFIGSVSYVVRFSRYIQGVPGGKDLTSGECSLGQTIPI